MIPSDHFVRMYNELFKMLEEKGDAALSDYWQDISRNIEPLIAPYIDGEGFKGMYRYWDHIRIEENCDLEMRYNEDFFELRMNLCPSLSKNLDNDAGLCEHYCDHCAGWIYPVMEKRGYYPVYDIISRKEPHCIFRVYKEREPAMEYARKTTLLANPYGEFNSII